MANIKDLFAIYQNQKVLPSSSLGALDSTIESADFIRSRLKLRDEFEPLVDYTSASNFTKYGSAKQYYEDAFTYVLNEYPYDGSTREKLDWEFNASGLDKYIFENEYPRTNGFVNIGYSYGTIPASSPKWATPSKLEYIHFKGGPHRGPSGDKLSKQFQSSKRTADSANYYSENLNQQSNLELDADRGVTVEFWYKKDSWVSGSESEVQRIVDIYNSLEHLASTYGRFRIDVDYNSVSPQQFSIFYESGSSGFTGSQGNYIGQNLNLTSSTWDHYAFSFANEGSNLVARLYVNGVYNDSISTSSVGAILGETDLPLRGYIGAMGGTDYDHVQYGEIGALGASKFSGSLDEFRFWKTKRSPEQIGQYWFTQINGGTNTDWKLENNASTKYSFTNPVDLGLYYKFNEGIINSSSADTTDTKVLDYSGRISNGTWTGYSVGSRQTGSAMVLASAAGSEFKDPILYSFHPGVSAKLDELKLKGEQHDINNNSSIYQSLPGWIRDEDAVKERKTLLKLTQIMSSYFDNLHLRVENLPKIKNVDYISGSHKPYPFVNRAISSAGLTPGELFADADAFEVLSGRDDFREFSKKLDDTKNRIYQNIYNNLVYVFKSKGTEKSIRNLIRCYGIGDELVKLNLYGNEVTYDIRDNFREAISRKRFVNFSATGSHESTVYQSSSTTDTDARSYVSSSTKAIYNGNTMQANIVFPAKPMSSDVNSNLTDFTRVSLFGAHTVNKTTPTIDTWATPDIANFQVYFVKSSQNSPDGYFMLSSSAGGVISTLTSSVIKDVYDGTSWNVAVRVKPSVYPWMGTTGATTPTYDVEFLGYNTILDNIEKEFSLTGTMPYASGSEFLSNSKRIFIGAHRTNFTGSLLYSSDAKISSVRYWFDYLDNGTILAHSRDLDNFGRKHAGRNAFVSEDGKTFGLNTAQIPQIETLALHWNFDTITGSNSNGEFVVGDYSSGSIASVSDYEWIGNLTRYQHPGKAVNFPESWKDSTRREFINTAKQQQLETINSGDMIKSRTEDDDVLVRDTRPINYFFSVEKSMYSIISEEMIKLFATVLDFNNLIGEPVHRYRQEYKSLEKARQLFFDRVENNTIDFEKFVDYFKWIDTSIGKMVSQLFPASSNFSDKVFTMIESHTLERNKYWNKFPTLEMKVPKLEAGVQGRATTEYPYKRGSAPVGGSTITNKVYWDKRAERTKSEISSGDATIDSQRETIKNQAQHRPTAVAPNLVDISSGTRTGYTGDSYSFKNFTKIIEASAEIVNKKNKVIEGTKNSGFAKSTLDVGSSTELDISQANVDSFDESTDVIIPEEKKKLSYKLENSSDISGYVSGKGELLTPFSLFSSSVQTGYVSELSTGFRTSTELNNYHKDVYLTNNDASLQGPFTERYVGGSQHRHIDVNTASADTAANRAEAWDLTAGSSNLKISARQVGDPIATFMRDEYAKRPINVRNIKWGTGSQTAGNYRNDYEVLQLDGRTTNNRFFTKNEGFVPVTSSSPFVSGLVDHSLPNYNKFGATKHVIVNRFSAPGDPQTLSRGSMELYGEEYATANEINQRNSTVRTSLKEWHTEYSNKFGVKSGSAVRSADYNTNAAFHKVNRNPFNVPWESSSVLTCRNRYDNWFIQHQIPRSEYQYHWVTASALTRSDCSFYGLLASPDDGKTNFRTPSGNTSVSASQINFVTSSFIYSNGIPVDFVGLNTLIVDDVTFDNGVYLVSSSINSQFGTLASTERLNSSLLHRNGPYQHSSWKQIRTGETSIVRFQKKNNTINIGPSRKGLANKNGTFRVAGTTTRYLDPPITFKFKPLVTDVSHISDTGSLSTLRHPYGNNLSFFSSEDLTKAFNSPSDNNQQPGYTNPILNTAQVYDALKINQENKKVDFGQIKYSEIVFPKDVNTGLLKNRQRSQYAENASGTFPAISTTGINGIDRGPLERRTFWRDDVTERNRRSVASLDVNDVPTIASVLPNSQGIYDGFATSINGWGSTPILFATQSTDTSGQFVPNTSVLSGTNLDNFTDCGELNSANYNTIAGYFGKATTPIGSSLLSSSYLYPTASCYYYHRPIHNVYAEVGTGSQGQTKWKVAEIAGKNPWYDTYEDYVQDIRGIGKNYSILPEFRISEHMEYYSDSRFRKRNDKYFTLEGAELTSSADSETGSASDRGIISSFFEEYSNTDFQKYFGKFTQNHNLNKITLKCNAIKKLLPYHGFYPAHRTLQIASLFSQSIAPHIGGIAWKDGQTTNASSPPSGALAVQSLLQPYFAPGIIYNTIKSGIACDWAAYTGSTTVTSLGSLNAYLSQSSNYRIPFEAIIDPMGDVGVPQSSSDGQGRMMLLYPTYNGEYTNSHYSQLPRREPYMELTNKSRRIVQGSSKYNSYQRSISNFLAEIPSFFLEKQQLSRITSRPAGQLKTSFVSGTTYYMDITLHKSENLVLFEDYWNGSRGADSLIADPTSGPKSHAPPPEELRDGLPFRSFNGKYFGPVARAGEPGGADVPFRWGKFARRQGDPGYAQYTPPYFYGKSRLTIAYTADEDDASGNFAFNKLQQNSVVTQANDDMDIMFERITGSNSPAKLGAMPISSSINVFGLLQDKTAIYDDNGQITEFRDSTDSKKTRWVISPKFETPVLNFSNQTEEEGYGRGMWSGYGSIPDDKSGVIMSIEKTNPEQNLPSLIDICFENTEPVQVGKLATQKEISEAIVAIPYTSDEVFEDNPVKPFTTDIYGRRFFGIKEDVFQSYKKNYLNNKKDPSPKPPEVRSQSIEKMIRLMDRYIIPPEFDFLTYSNMGNKEENVKPFVMYIFEFKHTLNDQDLADIWQGVMPRIATKAELSKTGVDDNVFSHPIGETEFFHNKTVPEDVKWMVFKVKKRANFDYFSITADTQDDDRVNSIMDTGIPYSYNWPYDYFTLVELAQIEVQNELSGTKE